MDLRSFNAKEHMAHDQKPTKPAEKAKAPAPTKKAPKADDKPAEPIEKGGQGGSGDDTAPAPSPKAGPAPGPPDRPTEKDDAPDHSPEIDDLKTRLEAQEAAMTQARSAMRDQLLTGLGVRSKFKGYAPSDIDPFTAEGRAALEKWASDNPELLDRKQPTANPTINVDELAKEMRSPHLVNVKAWKEALS